MHRSRTYTGDGDMGEDRCGQPLKGTWRLRSSVLLSFIFVSCGSAVQSQSRGTLPSQIIGESSPPIAATAVSIVDIGSLARDRMGNLYIGAANCVFKVDLRGTISRIAGIGISDETGDGGLALNAQIGTPSDLAVDDSGNIYLSEGSQIRKVSVSGIITTVVGTGTEGFSGDGGLAVNAQINRAKGIAFDPNGNLYFSDQYNNRIRKVSRNGIITSVAGLDSSGSSGDGGPAIRAGLDHPGALRIDSDGNVYVADGGNYSDTGPALVRKISTSGIITTIAGTAGSGQKGGVRGTETRLAGSLRLCLAHGSLYILETGAARIRRISSDGMITTVLKGSREAISPRVQSLSDHLGEIVVDEAGRLYIADNGRYRVLRVSLDGEVSTVAGNGVFSFSGDDGPAVKAQLQSPSAVAVDLKGNVYITDVGNSRLRVVSTSGIIRTIAGPIAALGHAPAIAVDSAGNIFATFSEGAGGGIEKISSTGVVTEIAKDADLYTPSGIAVDADGNLYVADTCNSRVRKISNSGVITTIAGSGKADTRDGWSGAACYGSGGYSGDGGLAVNAELRNPQGVATDALGNIFIADTGNNLVRKVSPSGIISTVAGNGQTGSEGDGGRAINAQLEGPIDVAVDTVGNLYISQHGYVREVFTNGLITTLVAHCCSRGAAVALPDWFFAARIALDRSGNLFVVIDLRDRIVKVAQDLRLTPFTGTGTVAPPQLLGGVDPNTVFGDPMKASNAVARTRALAKLRTLAAAPPQ